jgi:hypothetical protein
VTRELQSHAVLGGIALNGDDRLGDEAERAADRGERRAQLVAHVADELALQAVDAFRLRDVRDQAIESHHGRVRRVATVSGEIVDGIISQLAEGVRQDVLEANRSAGEHLVDLRAQGLVDLSPEDLAHGPALDLPGLQANALLGRLVMEAEAPLRIDIGDDHGHRIGDYREAAVRSRGRRRSRWRWRGRGMRR